MGEHLEHHRDGKGFASQAPEATIEKCLTSKEHTEAQSSKLLSMSRSPMQAIIPSLPSFSLDLMLIKCPSCYRLTPISQLKFERHKTETEKGET